MAEQESKEGRPGGAGPSMGEPSFFYIVQTLGVQALIFLGQIPNPVDEKAEPDLVLARFHISLLAILEDRTRGNLKPEEANYLEEMLHAVRMAFVHVSDELKKKPEVEEGEAKAGGSAS